MTRKGQSEDKHTFLTLARPGYTTRRPETDIEIDESEQKRRVK